MSSHIKLGKQGESMAVNFLKREGYAITALNFNVQLGHTQRGNLLRSEIDIIAYDQSTLCFIEVKTRRSISLFEPEEAVDAIKQKQIILAARKYRQILGLNNIDYRFDVVAIIWPIEQKPQIRLTKNYFSAPKY